MAPEVKSKKRKASVPDDEIAKMKKVKDLAAEVLPKKRKVSGDVPSKSEKKKNGRTATSDQSLISKSSSKASPKASASTDSILSKKPKSSLDVAEKEEQLVHLADSIDVDDTEESLDDSGDEEENDQTAALLKGFESDDDDMTLEISAVDADAGSRKLPDLDKKTRKKLRKALAKAEAKAIGEEPGVIYLGRIPHGFYENQIKEYFNQFGTVLRCRLSRNRKTGASKHYGFIEFASGEVAEIVSKTMDNYLMFGHILKCKVVPKEQVHDQLFVGANKRFKKVPWAKIEGRKLKQGATESQWELRNDRESKRRAKKLEQMKELGYEFDIPALKAAKAIPKQIAAPEMPETASPQLVAVLEALPGPVNEVSSTSLKAEVVKQKKTKKDKALPSEPISQVVASVKTTDAEGEKIAETLQEDPLPQDKTQVSKAGRKQKKQKS